MKLLVSTTAAVRATIEPSMLTLAVVVPTTASTPPSPWPAKAVPGVPDPVLASAVKRTWLT